MNPYILAQLQEFLPKIPKDFLPTHKKGIFHTVLPICDLCNYPYYPCEFRQVCEICIGPSYCKYCIVTLKFQSDQKLMEWLKNWIKLLNFNYKLPPIIIDGIKDNISNLFPSDLLTYYGICMKCVLKYHSSSDRTQL